MKFRIVHRESGLTLRQYVKQHKIKALNETYEMDCKDDKIHYLLTEDGKPGFWYLVPWQGAAVYVLSPEEWEVQEKVAQA